MPTTTINGNGKPTLRNRIGRGPSGKISSHAFRKDRRPEPKGLDELADRMDEDYQVLLARRVLDARTATIPITFSVEDGDERTERLKELVEELWEKSQQDMSQAFSHGRVAFEKVFAWDNAGVSYIRKLEALPFDKTKMKLNEDSGEFEGIELKPKSAKPVTIPPEKSWWLALDPTALEPHGRSRYIGAPYRSWKTRRDALDLRMKFVERFALGQAMYRGPRTREDDETGETRDNWDDVAANYDFARGGGLMCLPNDWDSESGQWEELFEQLPEIKDGASLDATIDNMDAEQIRAFGFSEKTVTEGSSVGSFAMVAEQMDLLDAVALGILSQYADSFQQFVIDKLEEINATAGKITLNYPRLRETVDAHVVETVKLWLSQPQLSPLILSGAVDVGQMLHAVGVPVSDNLDAKLEAMIAEQKAAAAMQPVGGPAGPFLSKSLARVDGVRRAVPTQETIVEDSLARLDALFGKLVRELEAQHGGKNDDGTLAEIVREIQFLDLDAKLAGRVVGMLSPFEPELNDVFGTDRPVQGEPVKTLAVPGVSNPTVGLPDGDVWRFPWVDDAVSFLDEKAIATQSELQAIAQADRANFISAPGINNNGLLERLRKALADSTARGEALADFRRKIDADLSLTRAQTETIYRTNTHQAYVEGQDIALSKPHVEEQFPFVLYAATRDTRTRPEHRELDGKIARRGSAEHTGMLAALKDWNCRCTLIPLSREDAESRGFRE